MTAEQAIRDNALLPKGDRRPWGELAEEYGLTLNQLYYLRKRSVAKEGTAVLGDEIDEELDRLEEADPLTRAGRRQWLAQTVKNGTKDQGMRAVAQLEAIDKREQVIRGTVPPKNDAEMITTLTAILLSAPEHIRQEAWRNVSAIAHTEMGQDHAVSTS